MLKAATPVLLALFALATPVSASAEVVARCYAVYADLRPLGIPSFPEVELCRPTQP